MRHRRRARGAGPRSRRGVALLFVLTTIAVLTSVAMDFSYNSRVNLELAAQSRDSLRARSLAMSGMNFARLVVWMQGRVDGLGSGLSGLLGQIPLGDTSQLAALAQGAGIDPAQAQSMLGSLMGGGAGGAGGLPGAGGAGGGLSLRLWTLPMPDCTSLVMAPGMMAAPAEGVPPPSASGSVDDGAAVEADFGEFTGNCSFQITDEDQKINVQQLDSVFSGARIAAYQQLTAMITDPRFDFLFEEEDSHGDVARREDVMLALRDWIDVDEQSSTLDLTAQDVFVPAFGDENNHYSRYRPRYKAKNAKFDSVGELFQVFGVSDAFMAAFGDRLTVYPNPNGKLNLNTNDPLQFMANVRTAARNPNDPRLYDPMTLQLMHEQFKLLQRVPFLGVSVGTFAGLLQANGIEVKPEVQQNSAQNMFLGDRSGTFRIVATGEAGRVKKTLTAVVRNDLVSADGLPGFVYWHEE